MHPKLTSERADNINISPRLIPISSLLKNIDPNTSFNPLPPGRIISYQSATSPDLNVNDSSTQSTAEEILDARETFISGCTYKSTGDGFTDQFAL